MTCILPVVTGGGGKGGGRSGISDLGAGGFLEGGRGVLRISGGQFPGEA